VKLSECNKFGTKEYGYHNWKQQQSAMGQVMEELKKNRFLEGIMSGDISAEIVNNTLVVKGDVNAR
jgi:hypothetical protein